MSIKYTGRCHCGAITFEVTTQEIVDGLRCDCSICVRKGAAMTSFTIPPEQISFQDPNKLLKSYQFGTDVADHYFCGQCGIYTFHKTVRRPGEYRVNLGCLDDFDSINLPIEVFNGSSL